MRVISGAAAARGLALGPAFQFHALMTGVERRIVADPALELNRLERAIPAAVRQVEAVYEKSKTEMSVLEASIFEAQILMLQDPELLDAIRRSIREENVNADFAVREAAEHYARTLERMDNEYFQARASDVRDVAQRLMRLLFDLDDSAVNTESLPSIVIARDLLPSDTVLMDKNFVLGFCTVEGSETSHTAILARALGIPAIVGCSPDILDILNRTELILDGAAGKLYIEPTQVVSDEFRARQASWSVSGAIALRRRHEPAVTADDCRVEVLANIGNVTSARTAIEKGAEGVGLLRTEFLYMERGTLPDEEEQVDAYSAVLDVFGQLPVTLRTSDIGGDKALPYLQLPQEMNPFLGVRGLRLGLLHTAELFKPQLKAALRAGVGHELRIMFPMVAGLEEVRRARKILEECRSELVAQGIVVAESLPIGIMVEVPSAAVIADLLAPEIDFFSIGTNDLTQYTLAADRTNSQLASYASAFAPAVLRLIQNVIIQAHKHGKRVAMCGELAGEPLAIPILLGFGLDEFSMNPQSIPEAKHIIRSLNASECRQIAEQALHLESADEVRTLVMKSIPGLAG